VLLEVGNLIGISPGLGKHNNVVGSVGGSEGNLEVDSRDDLLLDSGDVSEHHVLLLLEIIASRIHGPLEQIGLHEALQLLLWDILVTADLNIIGRVRIGCRRVLRVLRR
jgi:hypothetical protein